MSNIDTPTHTHTVQYNLNLYAMSMAFVRCSSINFSWIRHCAQIVYKCNSNYAIICGSKLKAIYMQQLKHPSSTPFHSSAHYKIDGPIQQI